MKLLNKAVVCAAGAMSFASPAYATIINFDDQGLSGPQYASSTSAGTTTVNAGGDTVTFSNGAILTNESALPADETSVFYSSYFLPGTTGNSTTISFSSAINNFFLNLYNGQSYAETFTVFDNMGQTTTVSIPSNGSSGTSLISFPAVGNLITITTADVNYDFSIDNIGFNEATPGTSAVPEPASWAMMLLGFGGMGMAIRRNRKRNGRILKVA